MKSTRHFEYLESAGVSVVGLIAAIQIGVASGVVQPALEVSAEFASVADDLALALISAWIFYLLVVFLPERRKRKRVRRWLRSRYVDFKDELVCHYLTLIGEACDRELIVKLRDPTAFSDFFSGRFSESQNRWHAIHNALYDWGLPEIRHYCQNFSSDCDLAIGLTGELTNDAAKLLQSVDLVAMRANLAEPAYQQIKSLLMVLFPLHCPWSALDGEIKEDFLGQRIDKV